MRYFYIEELYTAFLFMVVGCKVDDIILKNNS